MSNGGELAIVQDRLAEVGLGAHFKVTEKGLIVRGSPSFELCGQLFETLRTFERTVQFAIGDAAKYFRERFGERADQIISAETGWSNETIRAYEWMADKVPQEVRRLDVLTPTHHQKVAALPPCEQKAWLDKAAEGDGEKPWTVQRLQKELKAAGSTDVRVTYGVSVLCESEEDQAACCRQLDNLGRRYKTFVGNERVAL